MRDFFLIDFDEDDSVHVVEDFVDHEFDDDSVVAKGEFEGPFPDDFEIYVGEGRPADILANMIGYLIISARLEQAVRSLADSHTKTLKPPLFLASSRKTAVDDYVLLQVCRAFPCANLAEDPGFSQAIFDPAVIPSDIHIFRWTDSFTRAYVSEEFVAAASVIQSIGIQFRPLRAH